MNSRSRRTTAAARSTCSAAFPEASATVAVSTGRLFGDFLGELRVVRNRHQRLIDFMGERGRELAHAPDANDTRNGVLLHAQLLLGSLLFIHQKSDRKPRHGQDDHQRLKCRDVDRVARRQMDRGDQARFA